MKTTWLQAEKDPMGAAIYDYFKNGKAGKLRVFSSQFEEDEIPVSELFRTYEHMPLLEQTALDMAQGKILDVGAGSGCHSLALKQMGKESVAIDISPLSVEVMQARGLDARLVNLFDTHFVERFDTILMLMNGSGIIGRVENFGDFFQHQNGIKTFNEMRVEQIDQTGIQSTCLHDFYRQRRNINSHRLFSHLL
jgi:SAM-dependent methyltransferase